MNKLVTPVCATCGCSLIRLGVSKDHIVEANYNEKGLLFCCDGCLQVFGEDPDKYLEEAGSIIVCPTCLGEKKESSSVELLYNSWAINFCRCPFCLSEFMKKPDYYIDRLLGKTRFEGLFHDHNTCCGV